MRFHLPPAELRWLKSAAAESNRPLQALIQRRLNREPLQYILGTQPFGPLSLKTCRPTLIPRPETEDWVLTFSEHLSKYFSPLPSRPLTLLDLGTGTGCIPLLLCHLWPNSSLVATGVDISHAAVHLANHNAALCGISPSSFTAHLSDFIDSDFPNMQAIKPPYDILTSNPPYITASDYLQLSDDIAKYEDPIALIGGYDGLDYYRAIARLIARDGFLARRAVIALEVGHNQGAAVCDLIRPTGFLPTVWKDPWGKERTVIAHRR
ncbi:hypothetical protein D9757_000743 [Collybiopsis confluens]|uniref:peptide chain release factor N(5)-glutamine methyltransferase n=1 Tax=Collybiopsis confluens TaxID=2823264 RepID=A0A8H5I193_9AGAR|nr:hypothetical protein D9757_000743 [Collybiopsis confluens]